VRIVALMVNLYAWFMICFTKYQQVRELHWGRVVLGDFAPEDALFLLALLAAALGTLVQLGGWLRRETASTLVLAFLTTVWACNLYDIGALFDAPKALALYLSLTFVSWVGLFTPSLERIAARTNEGMIRIADPCRMR